MLWLIFGTVTSFSAMTIKKRHQLVLHYALYDGGWRVDPWPTCCLSPIAVSYTHLFWKIGGKICVFTYCEQGHLASSKVANLFLIPPFIIDWKFIIFYGKEFDKSVLYWFLRRTDNEFSSSSLTLISTEGLSKLKFSMTALNASKVSLNRVINM